ncbi:unnamed protein product, partial [Adineta ricciae]
MRTLVTLPVELVYRIFDHESDFTLLCSMNDVCQRLNQILHTYPRYLTLTILDLTGNQIGVQGAQYLANALQMNTTITKVNLCNNEIESKELEHISKALRTNKTLLTLDLGKNKIRNCGIQNIADALQKNTVEFKHVSENLIVCVLCLTQTLTTLNLHSNQIGNIGVQYLSNALRMNITLSALNLSCNRISNRGSRYLEDALRENKTLIMLNLSSNHIGAQGVFYLMNGVRRNTTLETLNLWNNTIQDKGAQYIGNTLQINMTLTTLNVGRNWFGFGAAQYIGNALKTNMALTTLDISGNYVTDEGIQHISDGLSTNQTLATLDLARNDIDTLGAQHLSEALQANMTLTELILNENHIGPEGARHLGQVLRTNKTLKILDLYRNQIENQGTQYLADALQANTTLNILNVSYNRIGDRGAQYFADALRVNTTLTALILSANPIGAPDKERQSSRLDWVESSYTRWIQLPFFAWITPILSLSNKHTLVENDLNDLSINDKCSVLLNRMSPYSFQWKGTWHALTRTFGKDYMISILLVFPLVMAHVAQPLLIRQLILYIKGRIAYQVYMAYLLAFALFISTIIQAIVSQQIFFQNSRVGMRIRNTMSSTIYRHLLTINISALYQTTAAQLVNLVANDVGKFEELSTFVHGILLVPLEALITFAFLWWYIGLPTLFGYSVLLLMIPIQLIFSRQFSRYRKTTMSCTDRRVQTINELINGCQIIKMYNWEKAMEQRVRETRQHELSHIYKASCLRALNTALAFTTLPLISLATFGGSWLMGRTLLSEDIFTALAFFVLVRAPVTITMPSLIEKFSESRVSARRIDQFMQLNVLIPKREKAENEEHVIIMEDASFSWKDAPSLFSLNMKIKNGNLVGVKGMTGSGKSTLFAAILGEINLVSGKLRLHVNSISYAPQIPWIFADTIRANILLGKTMDEQRYKSIIKACCLDIDLENFGEVGDLLMIGDKGV